jgi:hypothetical protein
VQYLHDRSHPQTWRDPGDNKRHLANLPLQPLESGRTRPTVKKFLDWIFLFVSLSKQPVLLQDVIAAAKSCDTNAESIADKFWMASNAEITVMSMFERICGSSTENVIR